MRVAKADKSISMWNNGKWIFYLDLFLAQQNIIGAQQHIDLIPTHSAVKYIC